MTANRNRTPMPPDPPPLVVFDGHRHVYQCRDCGGRGHWSDGWLWYGDYLKGPEHFLCPACSPGHAIVSP